MQQKTQTLTVEREDKQNEKIVTLMALIFSLMNFCSATMASKKDRGKGKLVNPPVNQPLAIKPESSPVGTLAISPITTSLALTNRFMTFIPEPNAIYIY
jgi:hypothetical protein